MKRSIVLCILFILSVCCFNKKALAAGEGVGIDFGYTGPIDRYTGEPINDESDTMVSGSVTLSDGTSYDMDSHMFVFSVSGEKFNCSVADGMVVTESVTFDSASSSNFAVYKDGKKLEADVEEVDEPGKYSVVLSSNQQSDQVMTFQIVNNITGKLNYYRLPANFEVTSVDKDGEIFDTTTTRVDLSKEGSYEINYICTATEIAYRLAVTIDHTPPVIVFNGVDKKNLARGPVTIEGIDANDKVVITRGDDTVRLDSKSRLTDSGYYEVSISDEAGNTVNKSFRILLYFNIQAWIFFAIVIVLVIGVAVTLYISKKKLRVR
ncbi:MAG: hypothetical protein K6G11_02595 [Lachnospiraceae bacterium]|nr:hypothetical protein [Lachnospiraceae bacterium]